MGPPIAFGIFFFTAIWYFTKPFRTRRNRLKILPTSAPLTVREPDEISVLCYNVLADSIVRSNANYNYASELYRSWEYRFDKLKDHIRTLEADVLCLQEIEMGRWDEWVEFMDDLGYTGVMLRREASMRMKKDKAKSSRHRSMTNATFYRTRRFKKCWEQHCNRTLGVGLIWVTAGGLEKKLYVGNVHLESYPYKTAERVHQVNTLLKYIEAEQGDDSEEQDIVFCGDFNCTRVNAPWLYLQSGSLDAGYTEPYYPDIVVVKEATTHPYSLYDVYKQADVIPEFTTRAIRRRVESDFIFASRHLKVAAVLRALDPKLIPYIDRTYLPNKHFPSDHIPLGVVLMQPRPSEMKSRNRTDHTHRSQDLDSMTYEDASVSLGSDSVLNVDLRATMENLDGVKGMTITTNDRHYHHHHSHQFLNDTALT